MTSPRTVAFRVDASPSIGTGHFMRCLTLAAALKIRGATVRIVSRSLPEHLRILLADGGHELVALPPVPLCAGGELAHSHWLGTTQLIDAQATVHALDGTHWDWVIVDHYALDAVWERELRTCGARILVIDDIADRAHDCDVLVDSNFYVDDEKRYIGKVPFDCRLMLGPRYTLLREEFPLLRVKSLPRDGTVRRLLVFFGGIDARNYTGRAISALSASRFKDIFVDVIIGAQHPACQEIKTACAKNGFVCHVQTDRMAQLMADADLAVGAGGTATWERACLGLPTIAFALAENQVRQIRDAALQGWIYAPDVNEEFEATVALHLVALRENGTLLKAMSASSMRAVDGQGVWRLAAAMGFTGINVRRVMIGDSENLFQWRNGPEVRFASRSSAPIEWSSHQRWFESVLSATDKELLIGERNGAPVGVVRFDITDIEAEVSIYLSTDLSTETKQPGLGRDLLRSTICWLAENRNEIRGIKAHVLGGNRASQALFEGAGFQLIGMEYSLRLK